VELDALRAQKNEVSGSLAKLDKKSAEFLSARDAMKQVGEQTKVLEVRLAEVEAQLGGQAAQHPEHASRERAGRHFGGGQSRRARLGEKPVLRVHARDHVAIGEALGILDFERGAKISGTRFTVLRAHGARLERALMSFMLDVHSNEHGYEEIWPPVLVKDSAARGTSQLPKFAKDMFKLERFEEGEGARTPLSGADGRGTRDEHARRRDPRRRAAPHRLHGLHRVLPQRGRQPRQGHARPHPPAPVRQGRARALHDAGERHGRAREAHRHAEAILQKLGLHFRTIALCTADLGFASRKTYDLEVCCLGDAYREISSCSWFGDFQARRAKIRFRREQGSKPSSCIPSTAPASRSVARSSRSSSKVSRADGTVRIPDVLVPYMGGVRVLTAKKS